MRTNIDIDDATLEASMRAGPFKAKKEAVEAGLKRLARRAVYQLDDPGAPIGVADLVLFEVLRGFREEQDFLAVRRALGSLPAASIGSEALSLRAAEHYRALRSQGYTIRGPIDVLLAAYCIENDWALLHGDRDFDVLESMRGLKVWRH